MKRFAENTIVLGLAILILSACGHEVSQPALNFVNASSGGRWGTADNKIFLYLHADNSYGASDFDGHVEIGTYVDSGSSIQFHRTMQDSYVAAHSENELTPNVVDFACTYSISDRTMTFTCSSAKLTGQATAVQLTSR